jgi:hypothetical protein
VEKVGGQRSLLPESERCRRGVLAPTNPNRGQEATPMASPRPSRAARNTDRYAVMVPADGSSCVPLLRWRRMCVTRPSSGRTVPTLH